VDQQQAVAAQQRMDLLRTLALMLGQHHGPAATADRSGTQ
jgi:hypothetical protein